MYQKKTKFDVFLHVKLQTMPEFLRVYEVESGSTFGRLWGPPGLVKHIKQNLIHKTKQNAACEHGTACAKDEDVKGCACY